MLTRFFGRRMDHPYFALSNAACIEYLAQQTDDDILLLRCDLDYIGKNCPLLAEEQMRRGLPAQAPENHFLPEVFFERDPRPRRLPKPIEYTWRRGLFLWTKYSLVLAIPVGLLIDTGYDSLALGLFGFFSLGIFLPLMLAWFTPFYRPLRYTVVRPFNSDEFSKPLKRFLVRNIGLRCLGVTLSDRNFKPSILMVLHHRFRWLIAGAMGVIGLPIACVALMLALLGTWVQQSIRLISLQAPSGFLHLPAIFRRERLIAGQHFYSGGQCFNIRTIDKAWKYAIQALVYDSDFVLIDLSFVRTGSQWEIEMLQLRERIQNCIAICQAGHEEALDRYDKLFPQVLIYNNRGKVQAEVHLESYIRQAVNKIGVRYRLERQASEAPTAN